MGRISSHFDEGAKVFDRFKIKPMLNSKDSDIFELEKHLIKKYLPKYNVVHATNGDEAWKPQSLLTKKDIAPLIERKFSRLKTKHPKDFERRVSSYRSSMEWIDFVQSQIRVYPYCQKCGKDNKELKVYHSNPISLFNETNEDVSVMCLACGDGYGVMRIY